VSMSMAEAVALLRADPAGTAIVSDFDGTLAPIVDDPHDALPLPGAAQALADLGARFGLVAVVSGRPAAFLAEHLLVPASRSAPRLVGLYGLETVADDGSVLTLPEAESWRSVVAEVAERGTAELGDPGAVERKGLTVTFHWRRHPEMESSIAALVAELAADTGLAAHPAKKSVEMRPPLEVDKGTVVAHLVERFPVACFLGDDVGDLPAFAALGALAISGAASAVRVAVRSSETPPDLLAQAEITVEGPEGVIRFLELLRG
jgi:trehalose 6-phosphate phosphatase